MKIRTYLFAFFILVAGFSACKNQDDSSSADANRNDAEQSINKESTVLIEMEVSGMTCTGCENTIKNSVNELSGIVESDARHMEGIATVKADTSLVSRQEIEEMINSRGYKVESTRIVEN